MLRYPIGVHHRDKPDFKIQTREYHIGVEVIDANPQDYVDIMALREKERPDAIIDRSKFKWGTSRKTNDELRQIIFQDKLTGPGWEGNSPEREWVQAIRDVTESKVQKLRSPDFDKFPMNWLLIYDNLPLPMLDHKTSLKYLCQSFTPYWQLSEKFDAVFVESRSRIIRLTSGGYDAWEVYNIWKCA